MATARQLSAQGYPLHLVARNEERLSTLAGELNASYTVGDVTEEQLFDRVKQAVEGPVHGLVYAVGTIQLGGFVRLSKDTFLEDFYINTLGGALAVQSAIPGMRKSQESASVVFFSSVAVQQGFKFHGSVSMAKGAIEGLTRSLAAELAPGIRVNAIAPSLTETPLAEKILSNEKTAAAIAASHPLQRIGRVEDVASMAVFLLSDRSSWMTGQIIGVDGGRSSISA